MVLLIHRNLRRKLLQQWSREAHLRTGLHRNRSSGSSASALGRDACLIESHAGSCQRVELRLQKLEVQSEVENVVISRPGLRKRLLSQRKPGERRASKKQGGAP